MPVYLLTVHAYGSWSEAHDRGYVQRRLGPRDPSESLARHRRGLRRWPPVEFDAGCRRTIVEVIRELAEEGELRLHAVAVTPSHAHVLLSFRRPGCECGPGGPASACGASGERFCTRQCPARSRAEAWATRLKRVAGLRLARAARTSGRPYWSRGWDLRRVVDPVHYHDLVTRYLPDHVRQTGVFVPVRP